VDCQKHALIKVPERGRYESLMQKTESFYMQEKSKNMYIIDDELYFVIDEKNNSVELTDKGIDLLTESYNEPEFLYST
jgi:preprotein translocase subunit SecA